MVWFSGLHLRGSRLCAPIRRHINCQRPLFRVDLRVDRYRLSLPPNTCFETYQRMQHTTTTTHGEEAAAELRRRALAVGERIAGVSSTISSVYYPGRIYIVSLHRCKPSSLYCSGSEEYTCKLRHTFNWATQESACVVEPGTAEDLSKTVSIRRYNSLHSPIEHPQMKIISETRTPFAVSLLSLLPLRASISVVLNF